MLDIKTMKKILFILTITTLIFIGCKKDDVIGPSVLKVENVNIEKGWDYLRMTAEYSYPIDLKAVTMYISEKEDMTDAKECQCVVEGKKFGVEVYDLKGGAEYYYCFEFDDGYEINRSEVANVTIISKPVVVTNDVTNVTASSAILSGSVTNNDKENTITSMGFYWNTSPNPIVEHQCINKGSYNGIGISTFAHKLDNLAENVTYYVRAYAITSYGIIYGEEKSFTTEAFINGHDWVDLGLPSGLKWATCNVGASSSEDYGDYYAWGETETKGDYSSSNSLTYGLSISELESQGYIDGDGNLTPSHDAATANWGGNWRLPTKAEYEELVNKCTLQWTTQNGVNGWKATGLNGNSIFLPAAGYRYGSSLYYAGSLGYYWSSTPRESYPDYAYGLDFGSGYHDVGWGSRGSGRSVRPVTE